MAARLVYLDNNATTQLDPAFLDLMRPYWQEQYFNPSSHYQEALPVKKAIDQARKDILTALGDPQGQVYFTCNATDSNNWIIRQSLKNALAVCQGGRNQVITSAVEHPSILNLVAQLEKEGFAVVRLPVNEQGEINPADLINALSPQTAIVSIMHANNETGVIFPITKLAQIVKDFDPTIIFHSDITQTLGKLPLDLADPAWHNVDALSFSGHKIYAPKGIGVLYARQNLFLHQMIIGGHQEAGKRGGTENTPYIIALAAAVKKAAREAPLAEKRYRPWQKALEDFVTQNIPQVRINGQKANRLPGTSSISFAGIEGESIVYLLSQKGICASTGSACSSDSLLPSPVLEAMQVPFTFAHGTIRFSWGRFNQEDDLKILQAQLPGVIQELCHLSPFWSESKQDLHWAKINELNDQH